MPEDLPITGTIVSTQIVLPDDRLYRTISDIAYYQGCEAHAFLQMVNGTLEQPYTSMSLRTSPHDYGFFFQDVLSAYILGTEEKPITLELLANVQTNYDASVWKNETVSRTPETDFMAATFLQFFERYNVWLSQNVGAPQTWPSTLNFARIVRNCAAHGAIEIRKASSPPVCWRGICLSSNDNGRDLFQHDLSSGDLVALLIEIDLGLTNLGAPIL